MVFILGLAAALALGVGFVLQQRAAAAEPPEEFLSPLLLLRLLQRPLWLAGLGSMVLGQLLGAAALSRGDVSLVEPLLAANLLFALPLAATWQRRRLGWREWVGMVTLSGGLGIFVLVGNPHGGTPGHLPWPNWVIAAGTLAAVVGGLVVVRKRVRLLQEATLLAAAAGVLYGLQDALSRRMLHGDVSVNVGNLVTHWPLYAVVVVAAIGLLLGQSAFEAAPLPASLPAITAGEPITGIALGVGVYGEHISLTSWRLGIELAAVAAMVAGVVLLARSPLVAGMARGDQRAPSSQPERSAV